MPEKSPETYSAITYLWVFFLAVWGGFNNYVKRVNSGHVEKFSLFEFVGEMSISAFAGLLAFYVCELANIDKVAAAVIIGISGHMGGRTIFIIEQYMKRRFSGLMKSDKE